MPSLAAAEERWRLTIDNAPVGIALVTLEGRFSRVNEALATMLGYSTDELVALTFQEITHPEDLAGDLELLQQLTEGLIPSYRLRKRYFHRDGHVVWIDLSVGLVSDGRGRPLHYVAHIIDRNDEVAAAERIAAMNADLRARTEALARSNDDLEAFAAMASHDLQAPLATVAGYVELLSAEYAEALDERGRDWLERVHLASERMSELVSSLLVLARSGHQATRRPVSTRALVEDNGAGIAVGHASRSSRCSSAPPAPRAGTASGWPPAGARWSVTAAASGWRTPRRARAAGSASRSPATAWPPGSTRRRFER